MLSIVAEKITHAKEAVSDHFNHAYHASGLNSSMQKYMAGEIDLWQVLPAIGAFVVAGIFLGVGGYVLGSFQSSMDAGSVEANLTGKALEGLGKVGDQMPILGVAVMAAIVISVVFGAFAIFMYRQMGK
jgi:site-specific recombinase